MKSHKETAAERRDNKHIKDDLVDNSKSFKKKNTKKWCKGKVGKEHSPKCLTHKEAKGNEHSNLLNDYFSKARYLVCKTCGKELDFYYPRSKRLKPDWVDK